MLDWPNTIWGMLIIGAIGSILGTLILKLLVFLLKKINYRSTFFRLFSILAHSYIVQIYFVTKCENENRHELLVMNHNNITKVYTRKKYFFICFMALSFITWSAYLSKETSSIYVPILSSLLSFLYLYDCIVWHFAWIGSIPTFIRNFSIEVSELEKKDKILFIENAVEIRQKQNKSGNLFF